MSLELLANELLFDLFEYFTSVDLFHSFTGLNSRFDNLLIEYLQINKSIDFRLIYKEDLNIIRRRYIPLFVNEITSICLSDDDTNPNETDLFISRLFPLYRFVNLQSISFYNIYSIQKMIRILNDLKQISNLTHLKFSQCHFQFDPQNIVNIMNSIWSLSNLTHCYLDFSFEYDSYLITPTIISCSIQYLSIHGMKCGLENLSLLYEHTPFIQNLSIDIYASLDNHQQLSLIPSLTTCKFKCETSSELILYLLRKIPNLNNLTIETKIVSMDGHMWESLIRKYLSQLKIFNLKMEFELDENVDIEQEIDHIIDSYRTHFWIDQHKWFIQCFCYIENEKTNIYLHTLPYRFQHFSIYINDNEKFLFKSTCPKDEQYLTYNYVHNLRYHCTTSEDINLPKIQCSNIRDLILTLPYDDHFRFIVSQFDNLISLQIRMVTWDHNDNDLHQLQVILDQAPRLYYLKFHSWPIISSKAEYKNKKNTNTNVWKMPPFSIRSSSVRYLDLRGFTHLGDCQYYNDQQCLSLIRSPLGNQCQFLLIEVEKRTNIIDLVNKMNHLRALNVRCRDRKKNDDEIIKWLQHHLPSTCSFTKDSKFQNDIRLWIR